MNANKYSLDTNEQNADYEQKHSAEYTVDALIFVSVVWNQAQQFCSDEFPRETLSHTKNTIMVSYYQ